MIRSDRGVRGVIDLNDLLDASDGRPSQSLPLAQLDLVALRLLRPTAAARGPQTSLRLVAGPTARRVCQIRTPGAWQIASKASRPGWQTAQREADLERLVDELSAELRRLDEDLELLLAAVSVG